MATTQERVILLPTAAELAGTAYQEARRLATEAVHQVGGTVLDDETALWPAGSAESATAVLVLTSMDAESLDEVLTVHPDVSWVQLPSAGVERYIPTARRHPSVTFTSAKGSYAGPVAEHGLGLTIALLRHLPERVRATSWGDKKGLSLNDATAVVIGGGGIGTELVRLLTTWDTDVTVVRRQNVSVPGAHRTVTAAQLDETLPEADVVLVAAAATEQTASMLSSAQFERMKSSAVVVNVARGSLVDTDALVAALADGTIAAAGLDVTDPEPLPQAHPLWNQPNALITPHSADTPAMCIPLLNDRIIANLKVRTGAGADPTDPTKLAGIIDLEAGY